MTKSQIILLAVGVVVLVGAGSIVFMKKGTTPQSPSITETPSTIEASASIPAGASGKKMPFAEFLKQGGSYKCTVHQNVSGADTVGTTYISEGMIRGEYNTKVSGMSIDTTLIVRDGYTHTWTSMAPMVGFRAKVVDPDTSNANTKTSGSYSFNAQEIGEYDCVPWAHDSSYFTLPPGVTFTDV